MRTTHLSRRQEARATSRIDRPLRAARLTAVLAMFLVGVVVPAQGGSRGGRSSGLELAAPGNDDFAKATLLGSDAGSLIGETNEDASAEAEEPNHNGVTPSRSVWYQWTPSEDGNAVVRATTHPYVTWEIVMGVYTGTTLEALTEVAAAGGPMSVALEVEFRVEAGTTYYLAIDGRTSSETGSFDLTWSIPSPPNDDFGQATTLIGDSGWLLAETNEWATAELGEPSHNGVASTPAHSVWYQWTAASDGTAVIKGSTRPYSSSTYIVMAAYTGVAVDDLTEVAGWGGFGFRDVRLEFEVVAGTTYHIVMDSYDESDTGSFDLTWALSPPANDDFANPTVLTEEGGTLTAESNERATPEIGEPVHAGVASTPARSMWYEWAPAWDGSATIDIATPSAPDDWDSVGAVYTGNSLAGLTEVVAASTGGENLHLEFNVAGGTTYRLVVDGYDETNSGSFDLTWANHLAGGTFIVTKLEDTDDGACDADCSLREAVVAANATGGDDIIELPAGTYHLTLDTHLAADHFGSLDIETEAGTTSIIGEGRDTTVIDATTLRTLGLNNPDRVFKVGYGAGLELVGVTVTGGYTENALSADRDGGGIWNWGGILTVTDCLIEGNVAGENGGGVANWDGVAVISNTIVRNNNTDPPEFSAVGYGGGIYNTGAMTITESTIELNASHNGGGIANWNWEDDPLNSLDIENSVIMNNTAWRGGGMANMNGGTARVTNSLIEGNHATRGWDVSLYTSNRGGGISNTGANLTVMRSTITGNETRATCASHPASGGGGGIASQLGTLTVIDTLVSANEAICDQVEPDNLSLCGRGGGIINAGGYAYVFNSTISGNTTALLNSDHERYRAGGGGGGFAHMPQLVGELVYCPVTILDSVSISGNSGDHGGGIDTQWETDSPLDIYAIPEWAVGDGYECPDLYVRNTIVAENTATFTAGTMDCWGGYTSEGQNLVGDGTGCPADAIGDVTTIDPMLSALGDFGGATHTHALLPGSPAINAGVTDLSVDQRGILRPQGPADDIGAFEVEHGPNAPPVLEAVGNLTVDEGDTLDVTVTATDADEDHLVLWVAGAPGFVSWTDHGDGTATLSLTPGFHDAGLYPGVAVDVSDGVDLDEEVITIDVTDVNAVPVADDQEVSTWQDNPVEITLTGSDEDGGDLAYAILEPPAHGGLSGTPPVVTYIPDSGFEGEDSFTFTVSDGEATSTPGTVAIMVHNVRPDPTFGTDGAYISTFGYGGAHAVVEQADGSILVAGWVRPTGENGVANANAVVAKLTPDGSLDSTFGAGGLATVTGRDNYFYDLVVEPDGQIVAVGQSKPDPVLGGDPLIARFDADGALDTGFGTSGLVMPDLDGMADAVALQPDGKIVVGGGWGTYDDLGVARLLVNGDLDDAFGTDGVTTVRHAGDDLVSEVLVQPDDSILLVGTIDRFHEWDEQNIGLVRLLPDGSPDNTFNGDGEVIIDLGMGESGYGAALQTDGKILIAGDVWEPFNRDAIVLRTTSAGDLDPGFGSGGVANIAFGRDFEQFNDLVLQPDGTIVAAGSAGAEGSRDFIVARLLSGGSLDPTFDYDGKVTHDLGGDDAAWALAVQTDGKLLLAGQKDADWAVLRLMDTGNNQVPVLDPIEDQSLAEADTLDVGIAASDTDGDPLIFTLSREPDFAALMDHGDGTATLSLTPGFDDAGVYPGVMVIVSDRLASNSKTFTITVTNTNQTPVLDAIGDQSVAEGDTLSVTITASDLDEDSLSFSAAGEPAFAALVDHGDGTATLSLTPGFDDAGVYPGVTVTVSDNVEIDSETFTVTVTNTNQAPVLDAIGDQSVAEGGSLSVTITAGDLDGDGLSFGITGEPAFATLVDHGDDTATLGLTPGFDDAGVYPGVIVTVSDTVDIDSETFTITVTNTNRAPVLDAIGNQSVVEGDTLSVAVTASDLDDDSLSFGVTGEPAFASLVDHGDGTATLGLTPGSGDAGMYPGVTVTVSDSVEIDSETFTITVTVEETTYLFLPLVLRSQ